MPDDILAGETPSGEKLSRRAIKARAVLLADHSGIGAGPTNINDLSLTFTHLANRVYEICTNLTGTVVTSTSGWEIEVFCDGAYLGRAGIVNGAAGSFGSVTGTVLSIGQTAASHTYTLVATRFTGSGTLTVTATAGETAIFWAKDIGAQ